MGTDNTTFGPGVLYDGNLKPIGTCQGPDDTDSVFIEDDYALSAIKTSTKALEFELKSEFNIPVFNELVGELSKPQPFYMEYDGVRYEQIRKHKKKRINKKWAKRYGYREVPCRYRIENCYIHHGLFNDFEVRGDIPKIVGDI